jgi:hypothetical protein
LPTLLLKSVTGVNDCGTPSNVAPMYLREGISSGRMSYGVSGAPVAELLVCVVAPPLVPAEQPATASSPATASAVNNRAANDAVSFLKMPVRPSWAG